MQKGEDKMIITVTLNPSIDISYPLEKFNLDTVNRVSQVSKTAGGKGLNVTRVLHDLQGDVIATGVLGGNFGNYIRQQLDAIPVKHDFTDIDQETRFCLAILHEDNQTEILEAGPQVSDQEQETFVQTFERLLEQATTVTISGSMAKGFSPDTYSKLIQRANHHGCKVLLDTSGTSLETSLKAESKPYLIKPNIDEISALVGKNLNSQDLTGLAQELANDLFAGIELIVISMGGQGALVKYQNAFYKVNIPKITVVNPVGSGDSTIAGMAYAIDRGLDFDEVIKYGMTCGVLNTMNPKTGAVDMNQFDQIYQQISLEQL